jgi:hypothetical protein
MFFFICVLFLLCQARPILEQEWVKLDYDWNTKEQIQGMVVENNILTGLCASQLSLESDLRNQIVEKLDLCRSAAMASRCTVDAE